MSPYWINETQYELEIQINGKTNYLRIVTSYFAPSSGDDEEDDDDGNIPPSGNPNRWIYYVVFGGLGVISIGIGIGFKFFRTRK